MCGIVVGTHNSGLMDASLIHRMCDQIVHRGPDSAGYHVAGAIGLGMRRLSIIDLHTGDQPIFNEDRSLAIVFNGEIYNYRELRAGLVSRGHTFVTNSDTEVIIHLYEEMGPKALSELNGMFGLAIAELNSGKLFIARDRLGIKPLYYTETAAGLYAASEIKSLLAIPGIDRSQDYVALDQYFALLYVPEPRTIFRSIQKLPAGCFIVKETGRPARAFGDKVAFRRRGTWREIDEVHALSEAQDPALRDIQAVPQSLLRGRIFLGVAATLLIPSGEREIELAIERMGWVQRDHIGLAAFDIEGAITTAAEDAKGVDVATIEHEDIADIRTANDGF